MGYNIFSDFGGKIAKRIDDAINDSIESSEFMFETNADECVELCMLKIPGVSSDNVTVKKRWVNRHKDLYLDVEINHGDKCYTKTITVNTHWFDKYSYEVKDGILTITLYEIINEEPKFELV